MTCPIFEAPLGTGSYSHSCGSSHNIHQFISKSKNLLHKRGFVDSLFATTVWQLFGKLLLIVCECWKSDEICKLLKFLHSNLAPDLINTNPPQHNICCLYMSGSLFSLLCWWDFWKWFNLPQADGHEHQRPCHFKKNLCPFLSFLPDLSIAWSSAKPQTGVRNIEIVQK